MKRIISLFAVVMLCSTPAFAAGKPGEGAGKGTQKQITNITTVEDSTITTQKGGKTDIGVVENKDGKQEGVTNITSIKGGSQITTGADATTQIGVVENKGKKQQTVTNMTKLNNATINNDGTTRVGVVSNQ